jgi:hypothetical protein
MSLELETNDEFFEARLRDGAAFAPVIETSTVISSSLSNRYIRIMIVPTQFPISTSLAHFEAVGVLLYSVECGCDVS